MLLNHVQGCGVVTGYQNASRSTNLGSPGAHSLLDVPRPRSRWPCSPSLIVPALCRHWSHKWFLWRFFTSLIVILAKKWHDLSNTLISQQQTHIHSLPKGHTSHMNTFIILYNQRHRPTHTNDWNLTYMQLWTCKRRNELVWAYEQMREK